MEYKGAVWQETNAEGQVDDFGVLVRHVSYKDRNQSGTDKGGVAKKDLDEGFEIVLGQLVVERTDQFNNEAICIANRIKCRLGHPRELTQLRK